MDSIMTTQLMLHTQATATPNRFETYWATGRSKQGIIAVTVAEREQLDPAIIAELSALHYLLSHKEVCGTDRAGNNLDVQVTFGAIRKLAQNSCNKTHLFAHGRFLLTRYADARITVAKDAGWIREDCVRNRFEELQIDEPLIEIVQVHGIGKVGLSMHVMERMLDRANFPSIAAAWRHLNKLLACPQLKEEHLPADIVRQKADKHGSVGRHLRAPCSPWRFVISSGRHRIEALPMLVTAYVRA